MIMTSSEKFGMKKFDQRVYMDIDLHDKLHTTFKSSFKVSLRMTPSPEPADNTYYMKKVFTLFTLLKEGCSVLYSPSGTLKQYFGSLSFSSKSAKQNVFSHPLFQPLFKPRLLASVSLRLQLHETPSVWLATVELWANLDDWGVLLQHVMKQIRDFQVTITISILTKKPVKISHYF